MSHRNNFDAIRLALATLVLVSHSWSLSGEPEPLGQLTHNATDFGVIAVNGFFVLSGYLITQSWLASETTDRFLVKRIRRLYPGYLVALAMSCILAALCSPDSVRYVKLVVFAGSDQGVRALTLLAYGVTDNALAFPANPYTHVVNGSMWTLQPELFCYLIVAGAGVLGALNRRRVVLVATVALYVLYTAQVTRLASAGEFTRLLLYFAVGSVWFLYQPAKWSDAGAIVCGLVLVGSLLVPHGLVLIGPLAWSYLLLSLAFSDRVRLHNVAKRGDLSYGVYLYAFVIQQSLIATLHLAHRPLVVFLLTVPLAFGCAWCSWTLVERRFLVRPKASGPRPAAVRDYRIPAPIGVK